MRHFSCPACGADLVLRPGAPALRCAHCGLEEPVRPAASGDAPPERDLAAVLERVAAERAEAANASPGSLEVDCGGCGATIVFDGTLTATRCDHCGTPLQRDALHTSVGRLPVDGVLPFAVDREQARAAFGAWLAGRWLAPRELARRAAAGELAPVYLPWFAFDALAHARYAGARGRFSRAEGGARSARRRAPRVRWTPVAGSFEQLFDDLLVPALESLPRSWLQRLEPWPLDKLVRFAPALLAGARAHTYEIPLAAAFAQARGRIDAELARAARRRIGGDAQRLDRLETRVVAARHRHLLLPLWILSYRFRDRPYRVVVNACTGEVSGEHPWSPGRVAVVAAALGALLAAVWLAGG